MNVLIQRALLAAAVLSPAALAPAGDEGGSFADVWVCSLQANGYWGASGGIHAFSVGTTAGNAGDVNLDWIQEGFQHPVIAQNMYRLKDGVLQQVGMAWVKHGFCAVQQDTGCGVCQNPFPVCLNYLAPGCSDPYSVNLNANSQLLGPRSEVNATTGAFAWPHSVAEGSTPSTIRSRIQVAETDILPAMNAGARWFVEGQYIHPQDAAAGAANNNVSYRELDIANFGFMPNTPVDFVGSTTPMTTMIEGWAAIDPSVSMAHVDATGEGGGRFIVASRVSDIGDGDWRYDYAVYNMNCDRSAGSFTVPVPSGVHVSDLGFHDVDYHSGEAIDSADWAGAEGSGAVTWATEDFATMPNANAIRWGTMYNFSFIATAPPVEAMGTIGLFKPGALASVSGMIQAPGEAPCVADFNGDGFVNGDDLATLLAQWGMSGSADIDGSGSVNGEDLAQLLANWGSC